MKRFLLVLLFLFVVTGVSSATTIIYSDGLSTDVTGAFVENFNDGDISEAWIDSVTTAGGGYDIVSGSVSGAYAAPAGDTTPYLTIPKSGEGSSGSVSLELNDQYDYFGLYWGSIDNYNHIDFYLNGGLVDSYIGSTLDPPVEADGDWFDEYSNLYVNFFGVSGNGLFGFDKVVLSSTSIAFELDNIAVATAPVPEPTTMLLFGLGLLGLAGVNRRKQ